MQDLSVLAFWLALAATAASVFFYWGYAFGVRVALRRLATNGHTLTVATLERLPGSFAWLGLVSTWAAAGFVALAVLARWREGGYPPWSNMWEFTVAFAGGIMLFYIAFDRWYSRASSARREMARTLGALVQPVALALLAISAAFFPSEVRPLVPALQNQDLLAAHVATMILAYGAFAVSFAAALMYLIQGGEKNRFPRLPKAKLLDEIGYRSVMVAFPLLTVGIALGAYWGNSAWGRYWGWDPKETSSLVIWLIYGAYLHMRGLKGWKGRPAAIVLVVGFLAVLFSYFPVNLWVAGLHSYAGV